MKLFLSSLINNPKSLSDLNEYIGGLEGKKVGYIPTASNAEGWDSWLNGRNWNILKNPLIDTTVIEFEKHSNDEVLEMMNGKDILWFGGGMAGYLMYWMRMRGVDKGIRKILETSLFVGSSAGSMIAGSTLDVCEWCPGDIESGASMIKPLNLVDFDIFPHYQDSYYDTIINNYKGKKLYLLKDAESIIVEDGNISIIGEERVVMN